MAACREQRRLCFEHHDSQRSPTVRVHIVPDAQLVILRHDHSRRNPGKAVSAVLAHVRAPVKRSNQDHGPAGKVKINGRDWAFLPFVVALGRFSLFTPKVTVWALEGERALTGLRGRLSPEPAG